MGENMYKKLVSQLCHISKRIYLNFVCHFQGLILSPASNVHILESGADCASTSACCPSSNPSLGGSVGMPWLIYLEKYLKASVR